jgi:hypothetical protein
MVRNENQYVILSEAKNPAGFSRAQPKTGVQVDSSLRSE